jgi:hypothetical protein
MITKTNKEYEILNGFDFGDGIIVDERIGRFPPKKVFFNNTLASQSPKGHHINWKLGAYPRVHI